MTQLAAIEALWGYYLERLRAVHDESGATTGEWIIIAATLAGLALTVTAIVAAKVTSVAEGIPTE